HWAVTSATCSVTTEYKSIMLRPYCVFKYINHIFLSSEACSSSCPVLECWFVHEKGRGGLTSGGNQEKTLLYISTDEHGHPYTICLTHLPSDPKPQCEINPFLPHPSDLKWVAALTESTLSPLYLQADWFTTSHQDSKQQRTISSIMRAPPGAKEHNVILSVTSTTIDVQARLGEPVQLDCSYWVDPSSPLSGSGFAVEWRYQFRGDGRLVLAYDGKMDRVADIQEEGATLDFEGLHEKGNASLILQEAKVRHSGMYICTVYLPYLVAQVAVELEIVEPPTLSIYPSPLPLTVPGQTLIVQCEASGFAPLSLELSWEFKGTDGKSRPLGSGSVTGHRQAWDGTFSQSFEMSEFGLCVLTHRAAVHQGLDVRVGLVAQILLVGALEVQRSVVAVLGASVGPGHRAMAVVGEVLAGLDAQETQEAELDHAHRLAIRVHIGELVEDEEEEVIKRIRGS
uniref:Ig-like domain-containing protein n=1 Tax=Labrus bergylta TaxID=56723 RepID=A0A3Q3MDX3_9LABR